MLFLCYFKRCRIHASTLKIWILKISLMTFKFIRILNESNQLMPFINALWVSRIYVVLAQSTMNRILNLSAVELMYGFSDNVLYLKKSYNPFFMNVHLYNVCAVWSIHVFSKFRTRWESWVITSVHIKLKMTPWVTVPT